MTIIFKISLIICMISLTIIMFVINTALKNFEIRRKYLVRSEIFRYYIIKYIFYSILFFEIVLLFMIIR